MRGLLISRNLSHDDWVLQIESRTRVRTGTLLVVAGGGLALLLGRFIPLISPLLIALILGAVVVHLPATQRLVGSDTEAATRVLLRLGVVPLGLRLQLSDLTEVGWRGLMIILVTVTVTYASTCWIGDRMGLDRGLVTLIAAGCAVCGAAAIAAVETGIKRRTEDVALAIALITLFGTGALLLLPALAQVLSLSDLQTAVWLGASIHEVAQVVAAAAIAGSGVLAIAMGIKLGRVVLLAPVYAAAHLRSGRDQPGVLRPGQMVPWFVLGFLGAAALRTLGVVPEALLAPANLLATGLLAAAMFGIGLGLHLPRLLPIDPRAVGLAAVGSVVAVSMAFAGVWVLLAN